MITFSCLVADYSPVHSFKIYMRSHSNAFVGFNAWRSYIKADFDNDPPLDYQQGCDEVCRGAELNFIYKKPDPDAKKKYPPRCFCADRDAFLPVGWI